MTDITDRAEAVKSQSLEATYSPDDSKPSDVNGFEHNGRALASEAIRSLVNSGLDDKAIRNVILGPANPWRDDLADDPRWVDSEIGRCKAQEKPSSNLQLEDPKPAPPLSRDQCSPDILAAHATFRSWFGPSYDEDAGNFVWALRAQQDLPGDNAWGLVIGGPSNYKTELLKSVSSTPKTFPVREVEDLDGHVIEGEEVLSIDLTQNGRDIGGLAAEDVVVGPPMRLDDGLLQVSIRHVMGRKLFVGPMSEKDYLLLSPHFDGYQVVEDEQ